MELLSSPVVATGGTTELHKGRTKVARLVIGGGKG
jgi:hypothetical protein